MLSLRFPDDIEKKLDVLAKKKRVERKVFTPSKVNFARESI